MTYDFVMLYEMCNKVGHITSKLLMKVAKLENKIQEGWRGLSYMYIKAEAWLCKSGMTGKDSARLKVEICSLNMTTHNSVKSGLDLYFFTSNSM